MKVKDLQRLCEEYNDASVAIANLQKKRKRARDAILEAVQDTVVVGPWRIAVTPATWGWAVSAERLMETHPEAYEDARVKKYRSASIRVTRIKEAE